MKLKCKEGDMAVVVRDTRRCQSNIGRLVQVRGPVQMNIKLKRRCWLIRPLDEQPYAVEDLDNRFTMEIVDWLSKVQHPDAWLHPLRAQESPLEVITITKEFLGKDVLRSPQRAAVLEPH